MTLRIRFLALLAACFCLPAWAASSSAGVVHASNLQQAGRMAQKNGEPVMIIFTSPDCRYCEKVINYYLVPMQNNPKTAGTVLIRQLDMSSSKSLVDFAGHRTTQHDFAKSHKVNFAPTIMVFTPDGKRAAKPLVGLGPEDYYGGFIDQRVATARAKMHGTTAAQ